MFEFYREMEQWMRSHYNDDDATFRPECRGGGVGPDPYTDNDIVTNKMRATYIEGVPTTEKLETPRALGTTRSDPHPRVHQRIHGQAASLGPPEPSTTRVVPE